MNDLWNIIIIIELVGGLEPFLFFHSIGNVILPTDELHHFSEGWVNHQPVNNSRPEYWGITVVYRYVPRVDFKYDPYLVQSTSCLWYASNWWFSIPWHWAKSRCWKVQIPVLMLSNFPYFFPNKFYAINSHQIPVLMVSLPLIQPVSFWRRLSVLLDAASGLSHMHNATPKVHCWEMDPMQSTTKAFMHLLMHEKYQTRNLFIHI